ncbi:Uma2 family endonuclease [Archangium violaceum]|uniref:Uma2 family endonuclease n=1 Tax=Archangium violaceum TaxID=83451 RepID=UPI00193BEDA4|nr:Uma2 family endonuclease [Archangium violaceum]QRK11956.1 Uma2 family endonuclease [Archangium violaceum]
MGRHRNEDGDAFPRAPTQEEWEAMGPEERARVVESLPGEVTWDEMAMPEGDRHFQAKVRTLDVLRGYFRHQRRKVYLGAELPVYYPGERRFAPDLLAVLEVEQHERDKWVVSHEGRGLDWVMEVHVGGDRKKDAEYNVERYARVGIPEYFIYDRSRQRLEVYRLPEPGAKKYERVEAKEGRYSSEVLGLEFEVVGEKLQVWAGNALLLESEELVARLQEKLEAVQQRADEDARRLAVETRRREEETRRREEEARRREEEVRRREEAERRLAQLQAELERLQHRGK